MTRGWQRDLRAVFEQGTVAGLSDAELLRRFLDGEGAGFEGLVARHGPMVLAVCRDVLRDPHGAEDAFQATFLVLVRKARSVRVGDSLGPWLYGVACRVARHARAHSARRGAREAGDGDAVVERQASPTATPGEAVEAAELRRLIHEELDRLPAIFRAPLVLCHLEGITQEEAARRLRCPIGTVRSRLARGRERLRLRMERRGVSPTLLAPILETPARKVVTFDLAARTATSAIACLKGPPAVGVVSTAAFLLSREVVRTMTFSSLKTAAIGTAAGLFVTTAAVVAAGKLATNSGPIEPVSVPDPASVPGPALVDPLKAGEEAAQAPPTETPPGTSGVAQPTGGLMPEELASRYRRAKMRWDYVTGRFPLQGDMTNEEFASYRRRLIEAAESDLDLATSEIGAYRRRWGEEMELIEARLKRHGQLDRATAKERLAQAIVNRNRRLNERIKGSVSDEEINKSDLELMGATAEVLVERTALEELELRLDQLRRRFGALGELLKQEFRPPTP